MHAQVVAWAGGPAFDGCLVFDECHKSKNFVPGKENQSTKARRRRLCGRPALRVPAWITRLVCRLRAPMTPTVCLVTCCLALCNSVMLQLIRTHVQVATLTQELQDRLPLARVLYCSATGVSEVGQSPGSCSLHHLWDACAHHASLRAGPTWL